MPPSLRRAAWLWVWAGTLVTSALALLMAGTDWGPAGIARNSAFWVLFASEEWTASLLAPALLLLALVMTPFISEGRVLLPFRQPLSLAGAFTVVAALAAVLVYHAYPLCMDEYAPWFQAHAFAAGHLTGKVPPEILSRLVPSFVDWFLETTRDGRITSAYWPGFALLLTPFTAVGLPWLLNPLIGGATILALWRVAGQLFPGDARAAVVLFAVSSPVVLVDAISFYAMSAHLLFSLVYLTLLLERPGAARTALAGLAGSVALSLHNPVPHLLFAAPWVCWIARRPRERHLWALLLGYLPCTVLLVGGWAWLRASLTALSPVVRRPLPLPALALRWFELAFALPTWGDLWARLAGLLKLVLWASPGLVAIAALGGYLALRDRRPERTAHRLLAMSALLTLAAYFFVPHDQGHGWGYRYFHSAWAAVPLLAIGALEALPEQGARLRKTLLVAALGSCVIFIPLRLWQVRAFVDRQLDQLPVGPPAKLQIIFVHAERGFYTQDLVQNDPFLRGGRLILFSRGDAADAAFAEHLSPRPRLAVRTKIASLWVVE